MLTKSLISNERIAIAFSGGGDSTALVHMLRERNPLVLIVDHDLRKGAETEALAAQAFARNLGLDARILTWKHDNPKTGLQEKARKARYGLMGDVCRKEGITHVLTGHTEDDQAETLVMRYDRGTDWRGAAGISEHVYAPVWPELAGITLVRPLLSVSRSALRYYNRTHELTWAEDPSNLDPKYTRIRTRNFLKSQTVLKEGLLETASYLSAARVSENKILDQRLRASQNTITRLCAKQAFGVLMLKKPIPIQLLNYIIQSVSGRSTTISRAKLQTFHKDMWQDEKPAATLAGVMAVRLKNGEIYLGPDPSVFKGRHGKPAIEEAYLEDGQSMFWDGRFLITAHSGSKLIKTTHRAMLEIDFENEKTFHREIMSLPHAYRGGMPAVFDADTGRLEASVGNHVHPNVSVKPLMASRLQGMLGTVLFENIQ